MYSVILTRQPNPDPKQKKELVYRQSSNLTKDNKIHQVVGLHIINFVSKYSNTLSLALIHAACIPFIQLLSYRAFVGKSYQSLSCLVYFIDLGLSSYFRLVIFLSS